MRQRYVYSRLIPYGKLALHRQDAQALPLPAPLNLLAGVQPLQDGEVLFLLPRKGHRVPFLYNMATDL